MDRRHAEGRETQCALSPDAPAELSGPASLLRLHFVARGQHNTRPGERNPGRARDRLTLWAARLGAAAIRERE